MASVDISKFFKWGVKGSQSTSTVAQALAAIQNATPQNEGIGFLTDGNTAGTSKILGMTARGASIDFTTLGGGTLSSAADSAAITFTNAAGQTSGSVTFGVTSGTSSYLTVQGTGSSANNITYGLTEAVYDSTEHYFSTAGVLTSGVYSNAIYAQIGVTDTGTSNQAKVFLNQGNQDRGYATFEGTTDEIEIGVDTGSKRIRFGLAQAVLNSLALANNSLQGFTIDGTSAVSNKTGAIATTGSLTGETAYNATTNPVATRAYVDAVETALTHTLTVTDGTTAFGTWTPTADGSITIPIYAGDTRGLVPAKTNAIASAGYYLAETGAWTALPAAQQISFGSDAASSNTAAIKVYVDGTAVSNTVTLTAAQDATTISGETLGITITGNANTPTIGLTANTIAELAAAHTAVQPLNAVIAEQPAFAVSNSGNTTTVTAQQFGQDTDKSLTNSASTTTFTIGDGALVWNDGSDDVDVFSANQSANVTLNQYDFKFANSTLGINTKTATSANNKIVTESDIAQISGAMHYKGAIDTVSTTAPAAGEYYTATIDGTTYYLHVAGTSGTATAKTPEAGDTLIVSGTTGITPLETGDMVVYSGATAADANIVQTDMTIGTDDGEIAPVDMPNSSLSNGQIVTATNTGIATTGFTFDAEANAGTSTITNTSTNAQVPTSANVYDFVTDYVDNNAVNSVTEATAVSAHSTTGATVTDTLTVDGTAQTGNAFNIDAVANSGITVAPKSGSTDTVEIGTTAAGVVFTSNASTPSASNAGTISVTNDKGVMQGENAYDLANAINHKFDWEEITIS